MKLTDMNETLVPPEKYNLDTAYTEGSYLVLRYTQTQENGFTSHVIIFLNDQGREVIRTEDWMPPEAPTPAPVKLTWWQQIVEGFKRGE